MRIVYCSKEEIPFSVPLVKMPAKEKAEGGAEKEKKKAAVKWEK